MAFAVSRRPATSCLTLTVPAPLAGSWPLVGRPDWSESRRAGAFLLILRIGVLGHYPSMRKGEMVSYGSNKGLLLGAIHLAYRHLFSRRFCPQGVVITGGPSDLLLILFD